MAAKFRVAAILRRSVRPHSAMRRLPRVAKQPFVVLRDRSIARRRSLLRRLTLRPIYIYKTAQQLVARCVKGRGYENNAYIVIRSSSLLRSIHNLLKDAYTVSSKSAVYDRSDLLTDLAIGLMHTARI